MLILSRLVVYEAASFILECSLLSLHRIVVDAEDTSGRVLKGNPVRVRDCARSCVIHNGFESSAIGVRSPRRPEPGEVRRPATFKFSIRARGQVRAVTLILYIIMKKARLLLLLGALVSVFACEKDPIPETYNDSDLTGYNVDVTGIPTSTRKIFLLNEGGMGSNNASLDFLRISDGSYITGAFKKMNPDVGAGLGDVGNDIVVIGDEVWMAINNSGIVEVISAKDETEIAAIKVATPRNIAFDSDYAYVTSWAGAYATYGEDYSITEFNNPKGQVYRIDLKTKKVEGSVEVGYQPEGIACYKGKLYVANSGGLASTLPPDYFYEKTVSIIDTKSFKVSNTMDVQVNLKGVFSDGKGNIYVTSLGNYSDVHSGVYVIDASGKVEHIADYVSVASMYDGTLYCLGSEQEFDWSGARKRWQAFSCNAGSKSSFSLNISNDPYGLCALGSDTFLVTDAGDYFNPGTVSLYKGGSKVWTANAGVCPGHFAIW